MSYIDQVILRQWTYDLMEYCPDHPNTIMILKEHALRTGYYDIIRKIMIIGTCQIEGCKKWFEYTPYNRMIMWP
jgi:hypothetical protein